MKKIAISLFALFALTACSKVTTENYEKLKVAMKKSDVESILGAGDCKEGTLQTECIWGNDAKHIKITFVADKVLLFSEKGL